MRLYNAGSGRIERFRPTRGEPLRVYVCGITPYDTTHVGHAFTYVVFDVLMRHARTAYRWPVRYVQNLTDIDDDILRKSAETGEDWRRLGLSWTDRFRGDMAWLNVVPPDRYPGATSAIPEILDNVAKLVDAGLAYASQGSVYFSAEADPRLGRRLKPELGDAEMLALANERGNHPDDPAKRAALDFVLWQASQPGEPAWRSPWGPGRPGWHIECSSLALAHLGARVDLHGGGGDLAFPHHACEAAQCAPLVEKGPWTRFWMHVAMVEMDGEKMSKSLGNLVMARALAAEAHPDTVRLYLLRHHYRRRWSWDRETFEATDAWTRTLHAAMQRLSGQRRALDVGGFGLAFTTAMEDDLDTPKAIQASLDLADAIIAAPMEADVSVAQDLLRATAGSVLGLRLEPFDASPASLVEDWPAPITAPPDIERFEG